jgi:hypothetical protein
VASGFAIEVEDRGLGIAPDQLREINERLAEPPDFDLADADRLGLFVTGRLAARHDVQVTLDPSAYRGIKAVVLLPDSIVTMPAEPVPAEPAIGGLARLGPRSPEALSLVGAVHTRSLATVHPADEMPPRTASPSPKSPGAPSTAFRAASGRGTRRRDRRLARGHRLARRKPRLRRPPRRSTRGASYLPCRTAGNGPGKPTISPTRRWMMKRRGNG